MNVTANPGVADAVAAYIDLGRIRTQLPDLVAVAFNSLADWRAWMAANRWIVDREAIARAQQSTAGMSPRHRMLLDLVGATRAARNPDVRIYSAEAFSRWAMVMRGRYPRFIGSAFKPEDPASLFPVDHQDVMSLTYPSGAFDIAVTQEILEHVPDSGKALSELARILKPNGVMFSTCPFRWNDNATLVKARAKDGTIEHLSEPEYHIDPSRPDGALVFQLPGWDILATARNSGFREAVWLLYSSLAAGIVGPHLAGLWCLVCVR